MEYYYIYKVIGFVLQWYFLNVCFFVFVFRSIYNSKVYYYNFGVIIYFLFIYFILMNVKIEGNLYIQDCKYCFCLME